MGAAREVELLQARALFMRASLRQSHTVTHSMISILGSFDQRLSSLETAMRPTQVRPLLPALLPCVVAVVVLALPSAALAVPDSNSFLCPIPTLCLSSLLLCLQVRTHAFRKAHENIDNTLKAAESVLTQFDVSRQVILLSSQPLF